MPAGEPDPGGSSEKVKRPEILFDCAGQRYIDFIAFAATALGAQSYFEIGSRSGASLAPITCASVAVDPQFALTTDVVGNKPACLLYQMSSDRFFARRFGIEGDGGVIDIVAIDLGDRGNVGPGEGAEKKIGHGSAGKEKDRSLCSLRSECQSNQIP